LYQLNSMLCLFPPFSLSLCLTVSPSHGRRLVEMVRMGEGLRSGGISGYLCMTAIKFNSHTQKAKAGNNHQAAIAMALLNLKILFHFPWKIYIYIYMPLNVSERLRMSFSLTHLMAILMGGKAAETGHNSLLVSTRKTSS